MNAHVPGVGVMVELWCKRVSRGRRRGHGNRQAGRVSCDWSKLGRNLVEIFVGYKSC